MMAIPKIKRDYFTYTDYLTWDDAKRWEIIYGEAYAMNPAPFTKHQAISINLASEFRFYLKGKSCQAFSAPFDVRLTEKEAADNEIENVVQPDISVFCDLTKLETRGAKGAPDLVVEILSPSSVKMDYGIKILLYQKFGIKEYWIIDPEMKTIEVYLLDLTGKYMPGQKYEVNERVRVSIFPDLEISLSEIFEE
jgi:Uma2 family endonuclease